VPHHADLPGARPGNRGTRRCPQLGTVLSARLIGTIALVVLMTVGCGSQHPAGAPGTGLVTGTVRIGPVTPGWVRPDGPLTRPLPGALVDAWADGDVVASAHTDAAGQYQLRLRPGRYLIRVVPTGSLHSKEPGKTVNVSCGGTFPASFVLDTGMR
jgi:Carboxypeptidase regulatory-like domain